MTLLNDTLARIQPVDTDLLAKAQAKLDNKTKPLGSLGRLEEFARRVAAISGDLEPSIRKKVIFTFAADHGVVAEGVSAFPKEVTPQMVLNFLAGGAGVNVLAKVGGLEIAGIAGLVLGAAANNLPVVVDGFISTAGALIACEMHPCVREYIFAAHQSVEIGHGLMLERIGAEPILDLKLRLGEGTGAALAMGLIEAGVKILKEMATFEEAGVAEGQ